ncbi:pullulanase, partial [Streptococcus pyogenes]
MGATLHADGSATINVWAPTAEKVTLNIYQSTAENAPLLKQFEMIRGTDENLNDHTKNTIGLWSYHLKPTEVELTLKTLNKVAYDYTLTIPKAYFIQKTEDWYEEKPGVWKKRGDKYVNSASASKNTKEELSSTASHAQ